MIGDSQVIVNREMSNAEIQMPNQAQNPNVKKKRNESQKKG